jgi:glycosyltransferase involved in cell wall biosynthesis
MPTVGIGIPVYNGERYLHEAIASALDQIAPADEVLVFVHDSSDRSLAIAQEFLPQVRIVEAHSNLTIGAAWNAIYAHSSCDYVVMLHADDLLYPHTIQMLRDAIDCDREAGCIYGITNTISEQGESLGVNFAATYIPNRNSEYLDKVFKDGFWPGCPGICVKRSVMLTTPFLTNLDILLDIEWSIRIAWATKIIGLPSILSAYRVHSSSTFRSEDWLDASTQDLIKWWDLFEHDAIAVPQEFIDVYRTFLFKKIITQFLIDLYSKSYTRLGVQWISFLQKILSKYPDLLRDSHNLLISSICQLACSGKIGYHIASWVYRPIHIAKYAPQILRQKLRIS